VERFRGGRRSIVDDRRSGQPSPVTCVEAKEQLHQRIRDNRIMSIQEIASKMNINHGRKSCKMIQDPTEIISFCWNEKPCGSLCERHRKSG